MPWQSRRHSRNVCPEGLPRANWIAELRWQWHFPRNSEPLLVRVTVQIWWGELAEMGSAGNGAAGGHQVMYLGWKQKLIY